MENLEESVKETSKDTMGFFKHVFKMDSDEKGTLLNVVQYVLLALIPLLLILKFIRSYIPEADDDKGSLVLLAEVLGQIFIMFFAIYFIHRIITYIPTFSGLKYTDFNILNFILAFLMIILTLQTKLGEKVQILLERVQELWEGKASLKEDTKKQSGAVRVTQPITGHVPSRADQPATDTTFLPPPSQMPPAAPVPTQQSPDFNQMYQGAQHPTQLQDAATPGQVMEPMAANDALGGSFGSAF